MSEDNNERIFGMLAIAGAIILIIALAAALLH
jgi:hypothetical protein